VSATRTEAGPPAEQPEQPGSSRLLTAAEVAERLRMTPGWVYAATRANRVPHVRLGRYVRFRAEAIERWVGELEERDTLPTHLPN
jgi:excisionase family DNA binding protein